MTIWTLPLAAQQMGAHGAGDKSPMATSQMGGMNCMMHANMMQSMHGMMMDQMMNDPFVRSRMLIAVLPTMKDPLSLSDEQVAQLSKTATEFQARRNEMTSQISEAEKQIQDLFASNDADPAQIRESLRTAAMHRADLQGAGLEAVAAMKGQLSADQRSTLEGMPAMQMHHHMMSNLTMMEMMQAMHGEMGHGMMMMGPDGGNMEGMKMKMRHDGMMH
jgi:septal ring factor EnvC (AmiA/AmiB activator)